MWAAHIMHTVYLETEKKKQLTSTFSEICSHTQCLIHIVLVGYFTAVHSSVHLWRTLAGPSVQTNQWSASVSIEWLSSSRGSRIHNGNPPSIRVEPLSKSAKWSCTAGSAVGYAEQSTCITFTNTLQKHNAVVSNRLAIEEHTWNWRESWKFWKVLLWWHCPHKQNMCHTISKQVPLCMLTWYLFLSIQCSNYVYIIYALVFS